MTPEANELSAAVRGLARDAHRLTLRGAATAGELALLSGRIERIRRRARPGASAPLRGWLDGVQRLVEGMARDGDPAARRSAVRHGPEACDLIRITAVAGRELDDQPAR